MQKRWGFRLKGPAETPLFPALYSTAALGYYDKTVFRLSSPKNAQTRINTKKNGVTLFCHAIMAEKEGLEPSRRSLPSLRP